MPTDITAIRVAGKQHASVRPLRGKLVMTANPPCPPMWAGSVTFTVPISRIQNEPDGAERAGRALAICFAQCGVDVDQDALIRDIAFRLDVAPTPRR